jgi:hypothetical protein
LPLAEVVSDESIERPQNMVPDPSGVHENGSQLHELPVAFGQP